jgi:hypothetical protein
MPDALAMVVDACSPREVDMPQLFHLQQADVAHFGTICLTGQERGRKLVTEEPTPVGSGFLLSARFPAGLTR